MQLPGLAAARLRASRLIGSGAFPVLLPGLCLGAFWAWGEVGLALAALGLPAVAVLMRPSRAPEAASPADPRARLIAALEHGLAAGVLLPGRAGACIVIALEGVPGLADRFGADAAETAMAEVGARLARVLREADQVERLPMARFGVALAPMRHADLETVLQIAARLQEASRAPLKIDAATAHLSATAGFCLAAASPASGGAALLDAAETALAEARAVGPGALRAFSPAMQKARVARRARNGTLEEALETGAIAPWFQPQINLATGAVSGAEALARWRHPEEGMVAPGDFIPDIAAAGLSPRLSGVMLRGALSQLAEWRSAGLEVPQVGVNFSSDELRDPRLVDRIRWELDRAGLDPGQLAVEVLESVIASADDPVTTRNIAALSRLGCQIDLDDFGTGHASIATIRRLAIGRLKIDRSFVTAIDTSPEQQDMLGAIVSLAGRLGLATLAEGVETEAERRTLAAMGCGHAQGFGIGSPMPPPDMTRWLVTAPGAGSGPALNIGKTA